MKCDYCGRPCFSERSKWTHEWRCPKRPGVDEYKAKVYAKYSETQQGRQFNDDHRRKMSKAAKARPSNRKGVKLTPKQRARCREQCLQNWKNGAFGTPKRVTRPHREIYNIILELGYDCILEHYIGRRAFDLFLPELNLLIEFNGTYYHMDPRRYGPDAFSKKKGLTAREVWEADAQKMCIGHQAGYDIAVVWEIDYKEQDDKRKYIKEILNVTKARESTPS